jgi:3-hydroxy-4-methylanthranilate adenylyltransferase
MTKDAQETPPWWGSELLRRGADDDIWACASQPISRARLWSEVDWLARVLGYQGIRRGSTVALFGVASFTQLWTIFALWSLGAQVILIDPRIGPVETRELREFCRPQFYVTFTGMNRQAEVFADECEVLVRWMPDGLPADPTYCLVQFSSGTTGRLKAIGRTRESLLAEVTTLRSVPDLPAAGERVLLLEPITRSFGLLGGVLHAMDVGATVAFAPSTEPDRMLAAAADADLMIGTPRHFALLNSADRRIPLPRLRAAVSGGEALPAATADEFAHRFGLRIGQAYGTTETGILAADVTGRYGPTSVGRPVAGMRTRISRGELQAWLPRTPYPYGDHGDWSDGWLSTNDLVTRDVDTGALKLRGCVDTSGRAQQVLDPGLDLLEIENVLCAHQGVDEAVVLGVDPLEAHVAGSADLTQSELIRWCRDALGVTRAPRRCHIVRSLPRTASGKLLRSRERLLAHAFT